MASNWLTSCITLLWLVGLNIDWDCLVPHYIIGSSDQWEFPPFFRPQWQSLCTALTAGKWLPLGLCKGTERVYPQGNIRRFQSMHDNMVNFLPNPHNRNTIACPQGRNMGCLLWVQPLLCSASVSLLLYAIARHFGQHYNSTSLFLVKNNTKCKHIFQLTSTILTSKYLLILKILCYLFIWALLLLLVLSLLLALRLLLLGFFLLGFLCFWSFSLFLWLLLRWNLVFWLEGKMAT